LGSAAAAAATDVEGVAGFSSGEVVETREGLSSRTAVADADRDGLERETRSRERRSIPEGAAKSANKGMMIRGLILHNVQG
jgi:hypothetical protein